MDFVRVEFDFAGERWRVLIQEGTTVWERRTPEHWRIDPNLTDAIKRHVLLEIASAAHFAAEIAEPIPH